MCRSHDRCQKRECDRKYMAKLYMHNSPSEKDWFYIWTCKKKCRTEKIPSSISYFLWTRQRPQLSSFSGRTPQSGGTPLFHRCWFTQSLYCVKKEKKVWACFITFCILCQMCWIKILSCFLLRLMHQNM